MKRICAILAAAVLCLFATVTVAFAAAPDFSATQWLEQPSGFGGGAHTYPQSTVLSYSDLSTLCSWANKWLAQGQYKGFHGTATLVLSGGVYHIQLVQNGVVYRLCNSTTGLYRTQSEYDKPDKDSTTTVPSTTAPSIDKTESTETDHTYISDPSTPSDSLKELDALNRLIRFTVTQIKSIQGVWRTNINMYNIQIKMRSLMWNMIDGINNITDGIYEQVDLLTGYLPRLDDIYNMLNYASDISSSQLNVQNAIYSGVVGIVARLDTLIINSNTLVTNSAGIGSRLDSIITNGTVQVNTASIDARLDKLISMYSKVNSVVLDTAAVNGGQISGAVGGALQGVMIYGRTRRENSQLTTTLPGLSVNGTPFVLGNTPLRSVHFTASVPAYITNDADLAAGVWKAGTYNYVSDTYNASTGEYVQRINAITLTGEETWSMAARAGSSSIFYTSFTGSNLRAECNLFNYVVPSTDFTQASANVDALGAAFTIYSNALRFVSPVTSVDAWKTYLKNRVAEGNPVTVFWVPDPATEGTGTVSSWYADTAPSITIPEGDSTITADGLRVTAKYETYESYTKTADIIAAINNIPPYDDSGLIAAITGMTRPTVTTDLTEVTSRLDLILAELQSTSGSATCEHTYAQHMEQDADCTLPGLMISTCSKCGDSYSEIVDPLGHDWVVSSHVDAVTDPDTGEETASAYDVYTCSRCDRTYEDHTGDGAPNEDYSNTSISKLVVQVFSKLGTFAGKLIGFFVHLLDKALTSVDNVISKFNDYTAQITGFGGSYTTWLTGFWGIIPAELQIALTFSVICMALGAVGKRLLFS